MEQSRIRYVKPVYPADPQKQGDVTVWFWIDTDGTVEKVTAVDGDPMLAELRIGSHYYYDFRRGKPVPRGPRK